MLEARVDKPLLQVRGLTAGYGLATIAAAGGLGTALVVGR